MLRLCSTFQQSVKKVGQWREKQFCWQSYKHAAKIGWGLRVLSCHISMIHVFNCTVREKITKGKYYPKKYYPKKLTKKLRLFW